MSNLARAACTYMYVTKTIITQSPHFGNTYLCIYGISYCSGVLYCTIYWLAAGQVAGLSTLLKVDPFEAISQ